MAHEIRQKGTDKENIQMIRISKRHRLFPFLLLLIIYIPFTVHAAGNEPIEKVTLQLKWLHQFQFAGYYAAIEKGYYKDAGLNVVLKEGQPGMQFTNKVVAGMTEYGIEMPSLLLEREHKKPVVVLAAIFQHSPEAIFVRKDSGMSNPHDLIGKTVMLSPFGALESRAMFYNEGISEKQLNIVEHSWNINDLIDGTVDAAEGYITDRPFMLRKRGVPYTIIRPLTYGVDFYGDCLFTSVKEVKEHPKRTQAFLEASLKGWEYAMAHPEEIVDLILQKYSTRLTREALLFEAQAMQELLQPKFIEIGHMNPGRWKHIADTLVQLKMLSPGYSLDGFLYDPTPESGNGKIMRIVWMLTGVVMLIATLALLLLIFNRKLNRQVTSRTEHLLLEVTEREKVEKNLKANESFLNSVIENIPNMIFVKETEELRYVRINKTGEELLGYATEDFVGRNDYDLFPKEEADFFTRKDRDVLQNKIMVDIPEETIQTRDKGSRILHTKKIPILNEQGEPEFLLGISEDITEHQQAAEEKKMLAAKLRQAQKMESIGTLAGGIAHDFNNILTAIYGYAELARMEITRPEKAEKYIKEILQGADRARELVNQILTFSRKGERILKPLHVQSIIKEAFKLLRSTLPTTIEITQDINPDCDPVLADPTEIHQVIMNLCTNAYHAMRRSGGVLSISVQPVHLDDYTFSSTLHLQPGSYLKIEIQDTGEGMPEKVLGRIFEPYYTTKEQGEGTGLGLAVAHGIITGLHGDITVCSNPGKGTTFTFYLPTVTASEETITESTPEPLPAGSERILIVDDDEAIIHMEQQMLSSLGYTVTPFTDSEECLKFFQEHPEEFDVIITDMTMPGMTGDIFAKEVLKIRPDMPIILCTGFSDRIDEKKAKAIGIGEYVMKPILMKNLVGAVHRVLEGS